MTFTAGANGILCLFPQEQMSFSAGISFTPAENVTFFHYTLASCHGGLILYPLGLSDFILDPIEIGLLGRLTK